MLRCLTLDSVVARPVVNGPHPVQLLISLRRRNAAGLHGPLPIHLLHRLGHFKCRSEISRRFIYPKHAVMAHLDPLPRRYRADRWSHPEEDKDKPDALDPEG